LALLAVLYKEINFNGLRYAGMDKTTPQADRMGMVPPTGNAARVHIPVLKANHQDGNWQGIPVKKGQLVTGRKRLSEETGLSEQKIRGCLNKLKSTGDITIKPTNRFSLVTICNYCTYQPDAITINQPIDQQATNRQPTDNQQVTTNKNVKKVENEKENNSPEFILFESARLKYPGTKRGGQTEFKDFKRRIPNWKFVIDLLLPAIQNQIDWRVNAGKEFRPPWKHFKTWLGGSHWEDVLSDPEAGGKECVDCQAPYAEGHKFTINTRTGKKEYRCKECR